eukprot:CAMPEP_0182419798 /NCGR_PEP_ID=MMETSP1167-20130531/4164_1 /TAXON_ID=2988 /ORGANISM="Mallomonas Sp, Strain CCMP3275" /LENGTH=482 /DNA_ID=CAMNT_0024594897 /DNA_START=42 /DNA_END=1490 /DNA_ORIENTATION=-
MDKSPDLSDLKFMIDSNQFITYRWLAYSMNISMESSKRAMSDFIEKYDKTRATYLISGILASTSVNTYAVVEDNKVESTKKLFSKVHTNHVYSIHKELPSDIFSQLAAVDMEQANDLIYQSKDEIFLNNRLSSLTCEDIIIHPEGSKPLPLVSSTCASKARDASHTIATVGDKSSKNTSISTAKPKTSSLPSAAARDFFKSNNSIKPSAQSKSPDMKTSKKKDDVSQAPSPSTESEETPINITENIQSSTVKTKEKAITTGTKKSVEKPTQGQQTAEDDSDAEWDDGSGFVPKPKPVRKQEVKEPKVTKKNRKAVHEVEKNSSDSKPESESTPVVEERDDGDENDQYDDVIEKKPKKKKQTVVFGAMNDFVTSRPMESTDDTNTDSKLGKRKRKVLIEKSFVDEKGYLVTEMVWEEVSDDETAPPSKPAASPKKSHSPAVEMDDDHETGATNKQKNKVVPKKKKAVEPAAAQKSISSFFGKK